MLREKFFARSLNALKTRAQLPLTVAMWDGAAVALGPTPRVTIRLPDPAAIRFFMPPSLGNLARGYVTRGFDVEGRLEDIIDAAAGLARAGLSENSAVGRLIRSVTHTRDADARDIAHHYDVSNAFYGLWLDPALVYSCAYFQSAEQDLASAQEAKLDHIFAKIMLKPDERLLDIGCGWGALALRAAQKFGARVVGVTLSRNQCDLARERVRAAGLADQVEIRLQDYRDVSETFDKITSVGMFEHVGLKHLEAYFAKIHGLLADGGLALNHGITSTHPDSRESPYGAGDFIGTYVFPHGELPHIGLVLQKMQAAGLEALDVESLRRHYARTLARWADNYENHSDQIRREVDETTYRVWRIYLAGCAHAFRENWVSIHQVLACKAGPEGLNPTPLTRNYMYA